MSRFSLIIGTMLLALIAPSGAEYLGTSSLCGSETDNTQIVIGGDIQLQPKLSGPSFGSDVGGIGYRTTGEVIADPAFVFRGNGYLFENTTPEWMMVIRDNGNVGIGIQSTQPFPVPQYKLDVQGAGVDDASILDHDLRITSRLASVNGEKGLLFGFSSSRQLGDVMCQGENCGIRFVTHNGAWAARMIISETGNVGIGTSTPTSKLQVVGLPVYHNNADAISGGLTVGAFYRTGADPDPVCVVH